MWTNNLVYKLVNGEQFIAKNEKEKLVANNKEFITFHKPLLVNFQMTNNGIGVGFMPWNDEVTIRTSSIIAYFDPPEEVEKQYLQITSGIQLMN